MMKNIILISLFLVPSLCSAQMTYMNVQFDYEKRWETSGHSSIETDSFYFVPSSGSSPFQSIGDTSFMLKVNKYSAEITYKKIIYFEGQSVISALKKENTILIHGSNYMGIKEYDDVDNNVYLSLLDMNNLAPLIVKEYGMIGRVDVLYRPIPTSDGGFFSTGWSFEPTGRSSLIFFKCDSNLNPQYFKLYPPVELYRNYFASGAVELSDNGIMVVGNHWENGENKCDALMVKVDTVGNVVWIKKKYHVGDTTQYTFGDIIPKGDGTYIAVGNRRYGPQVGTDYDNFWIVNLDGDGNILWEKKHREDYYAGWQTITPSLDGNFYACGVATTYNDTFPTGFRQYAVISKLTPNGDLLWHRKYLSSPEGKYYDQFFNVMATSDGGILCNGTTWENDTTRQNAWIVKLDGNGCLSPSQPGCVSDTDEPIVLPVGQNSWVSLSPNPTSGLVRVIAKEEHRIEYMRVYDTAGRLVEERRVPKESETTCDLSSQRAGTYIFSVLVDGVWNVRQVVKS